MELFGAEEANAQLPYRSDPSGSFAWMTVPQLAVPAADQLAVGVFLRRAAEEAWGGPRPPSGRIYLVRALEVNSVGILVTISESSASVLVSGPAGGCAG